MRKLYADRGWRRVYSLAKNAGTSVNQIERFYAKGLPISKELMPAVVWEVSERTSDRCWGKAEEASAPTTWINLCKTDISSSTPSYGHFSSVPLEG